jgi:hypothetical protein
MSLEKRFAYLTKNGSLCLLYEHMYVIIEWIMIVSHWTLAILLAYNILFSTKPFTMFLLFLIVCMLIQANVSFGDCPLCIMEDEYIRREYLLLTFHDVFHTLLTYIVPPCYLETIQNKLKLGCLFDSHGMLQKNTVDAYRVFSTSSDGETSNKEHPSECEEEWKDDPTSTHYNHLKHGTQLIRSNFILRILLYSGAFALIKLLLLLSFET